MKIAVIIQARMSSRRLPGKVLKEIDGRPLLAYLLDGLRKASRVGELIIATSANREDDPIETFADDQNINCFRGERDNVAGRLCLAAQEFGFSYFVRVNGDSPLLDFRLIDRACKILEKRKVDVVTNVHPRTFPKGQSVELIRTKALLDVLDQTSDCAHLEHVTSYFYANYMRYQIRNFHRPERLDHLNYCVDTSRDFSRITRVIGAMSRQHTDYTYEELGELIGTHENAQCTV
jgi:spore coat polysaccharide biosynthesis protein SpsF